MFNKMKNIDIKNSVSCGTVSNISSWNLTNNFYKEIERITHYIGNSQTR